MLRSMFSGVSGLRSHQTMMDVIGNNIANVNTVGYKSASVVFQDLLSQTIRGAGVPDSAANGAGGTNPAQVGLGVTIAGISNNFTQGASQLTGRSTDLSIQGDGFFVVRNNGQQLYTRAGSLNFDALGRLTTADGSILQGWTADGSGAINANASVGDLSMPLGQSTAPTATGNLRLGGNLPATGSWGTNPIAVDFGASGDAQALRQFAGQSTVAALSQDGSALGTLQSFTIGQDGIVTGVFSNGRTRPIGQIALAGFSNASGLEKTGNSLDRASVNSGLAQVGQAGSGGRGTLSGSTLEMSNVDLAQEFTNLIIAQRGFQANSRVITASDELLQDLVNLKR